MNNFRCNIENVSDITTSSYYRNQWFPIISIVAKLRLNPDSIRKSLSDHNSRRWVIHLSRTTALSSVYLRLCWRQLDHFKQKRDYSLKTSYCHSGNPIWWTMECCVLYCVQGRPRPPSHYTVVTE